ncbi:MAG: hypothetical protein GXP15_14480 [Gammaproteobacteria bacterium]|nr:hypothetical protein [Gammaproteobacteria bacterium]
MFKAIRIGILLFILFFVAVSTLLTQARSTDWDSSLWVKIYPINADGSEVSRGYIDKLEVKDFSGIEAFIDREIARYGRDLRRPVRIELGREITEQPPALGGEPSAWRVMLWSLKIRWWASSVTDEQDNPAPDVRIFVRYHSPSDAFRLENSVGLQKGMVGIVNAFASRGQKGSNNVVIAHEFLHTLGATDKYDPADGNPTFPEGYGEPDRSPRFPQRLAEIMGGRIAISALDAEIPKSLRYAVIGEQTAEEIRLR